MMDVLYYSCPYDLSGYGAVSRNHLMGLTKYDDMRMRLRSRRFWRGPSPNLGEIGENLKMLETNPIANKDFLFIQHLTPENFFIDPRAAYHVCYTPFETDGAPITWLLGLKAMDEIWVPSEENKKSYIKMGLDEKKIKVIPHGADTNKYNPSVKPLTYDHGKFNFGSVFDWTERKNPKALVRAYYNAFKKNEDVSLTLRVFWKFPIEDTLNYIRNEVHKIKQEFEKENGRKDFPKIVLWTEILPDNALPNLYKSFDCFVLPSRGEGFGLPLIEAMACGVPSVGPSWGGNTDFMNKENSFLIDGKLVPINNAEFLRTQPQYGGQNWFDIDESKLSNTMRWIYDHQGEAKKVGDKAAKDIAESWTWDHTSAKLHRAIQDTYDKINGEKNIKEDMNFMEVKSEKSTG